MGVLEIFEIRLPRSVYEAINRLNLVEPEGYIEIEENGKVTTEL